MRRPHRLVRELARPTGESQTAAVTIAVQERLDRLQPSGGAGWPTAFSPSEGHRPRLKEPFRSAEHGELLDDEHGLPR